MFFRNPMGLKSNEAPLAPARTKAPLERRYVLGMSVAIFALVGMFTAFGISNATGVRSAAIPSYTITAMDFSYTMPSSVSAGLVEFKFINNGPAFHQAQFLRLKNGVTPQMFLDTLKTKGVAALALTIFAGGPDSLGPGQNEYVFLRFKPGVYVALCFVTNADKVPHFAKGQLKFFKVVPSDRERTGIPKADGQVTLFDFNFKLPQNLKAGIATLKVVNDGPQPHELALFKLAPGKTPKDVLAYLKKSAGPSPGFSVGGMAALAPNTTGWVRLPLSRGTYAALCFVPDPNTGKPHVALGMITFFTVQ